MLQTFHRSISISVKNIVLAAMDVLLGRLAGHRPRADCAIYSTQASVVSHVKPKVIVDYF